MTTSLLCPHGLEFGLCRHDCKPTTAQAVKRLTREQVIEAARKLDPRRLADVDRDGEPYKIADAIRTMADVTLTTPEARKAAGLPPLNPKED